MATAVSTHVEPRSVVKTITPSKGPLGSLYPLAGRKGRQDIYVRTGFGNRLIEEPIGSVLLQRQQNLYMVIRALTKRLLILMALSLIAGLALGYWGSR